MNKVFYHGLFSSILAIMASSGYFILYQAFLGTHFNKIINYGSIAGASAFGCFLMSAGYYFIVNKYGYKKTAGWLNLLYVLLSFGSAVSPFLVTLPLNIGRPELFPGIAIPMHFFPVLAFLTLAPFYRKERQ